MQISNTTSALFDVGCHAGNVLGIILGGLAAQYYGFVFATFMLGIAIGILGFLYFLRMFVVEWLINGTKSKQQQEKSTDTDNEESEKLLENK